MKSIVYCRVSSREQGESGLGLEAQKARCLAEIGSRGWSLVNVVEEVASAGPKKRPKLDQVLRLLEVGQAEALIVSRLDRLARSLLHFALIMAAADKQGWKVVCLDPMVDMSTPYGRMMGNVAMSFAQLERELGSIRTKEGHAVARSRGVRIGNPRYDDQTTIRRIVRLVDEGKSFTSIAKLLTEAGVPTPMGAAKWSHRTISLIYRREQSTPWPP